MEYICHTCDHVFSDGQPDSDSLFRPVCPKCDSSERVGKRHYASASDTVYTTESAVGTVIRFTQRILEEAERFNSINEYRVAIIFAQTACEIATERAIIAALKNRQVSELEDVVDELFMSYSIKNEKVRMLYSALTGDDLTVQKFWADLRQSAVWRNDIVHDGKEADSSMAKRAIEAARLYIEHIQQF